MIDVVNQALLEIQAALLARSLYPEGHPRIRRSESRALELLSEALQQRPEIALFALDGRVIFDSELLPSCASLADTLFRMLQVNGVDQITFRRGIERRELIGLLDALADGAYAGHVALEATAHLGFGSLQSSKFQVSESGPLIRSSAIAYAEEAADALPGIWQAVKVASGGSDRDSASRELQTGRLGDIVTKISTVIDGTASAMLPLAPLKRHDEYTFVHTVNVAILSTALAEALGYDNETVRNVNIAALLHDVGKQAVPPEILNKNSRFDDDERLMMQKHPVIGARMLLNSPGIPELAVVVAYEHHIRADGSGYPAVPPDWKLNMASRIVQLADVFDALRTDRPYRLGLPVPKIVEMMRNDMETFFDEELLELFFQEVVSRGIPEPSRVAERPDTDAAESAEPSPASPA